MPRAGVPTRVVGTAGILAAWRTGKSPRTLAAYANDLADFAAWGTCAIDDMLTHLFCCDAGAAHQLALGYLAHLTKKGLALATITRRIAALRSLTHAARLIGIITWTLELPMPKVVAYRDTRGPGRAVFGGSSPWLQNKPNPNAPAIWRFCGSVTAARCTVPRCVRSSTRSTSTWPVNASRCWANTAPSASG